MAVAGAGGVILGESTKALFASRKQQVLRHVDLSRKGSIDDYIRPLVECINSNRDYVTTSSCSGRILIYCEGERKKKGCHWLLTSHNPITLDEVIASLSTELPIGDVNFKFEPFVLHVLCASLEAAADMHRFAIASGFKNSGIGVSKKNKIILAIRSTIALEAPIATNGKLIVDHKYLSHLVSVANEKMLNNNSRIDRLYAVLKPTGIHDTTCSKLTINKVGNSEVPETDKAYHCSNHILDNSNKD